MTQLPNNCRAGSFSVFPSNWKLVNANRKLSWRITYWFYDDNLAKKKKVVIKGMNHMSILKDKQDLVKVFLADELNILLNQGYNPITGVSQLPVDINYEIQPGTPFIEALNAAREKMNTCMADLKSVIKYTEKAARQLNIDSMPVDQIKRRDIKRLLEHLPKVKTYWSANTFNYYRAHLSMLFKQLLEYEAVEYNPVKEISEMRNTVRIRETLSKDARKKVDQHLRKLKMMRFRIFIKLFFHSGIRITEMLRLKGKDVDLKMQQLKCLIKKGRSNEEKLKPIKSIAMRYWKLAVKNCAPGDYLFSYRLKPGKKLISPGQITRRWNRYIKQPAENGGLGVTSDFYALKHGNTTEMVDRLGEQEAAELNSHTSTAMVRKIYDTKQVSRQQARIMGADNEF